MEDEVAFGQARVMGVDDPADRAALQRRVQREVAVHHLAVVRVDGPVEVLHECRAGPGFRYG
jgi:hypothetical protein